MVAKQRIYGNIWKCRIQIASNAAYQLKDLSLIEIRVGNMWDGVTVQ